MSQFKSVNCPNCGAQLVGQANKYYCAYCNAIVETNEYDKVIKVEHVITANITETKVIRDEAQIEKMRKKYDPHYMPPLLQAAIGIFCVLAMLGLVVFMELFGK